MMEISFSLLQSAKITETKGCKDQIAKKTRLYLRANATLYQSMLLHHDVS